MYGYVLVTLQNILGEQLFSIHNYIVVMLSSRLMSDEDLLVRVRSSVLTHDFVHSVEVLYIYGDIQNVRWKQAVVTQIKTKNGPYRLYWVPLAIDASPTGEVEGGELLFSDYGKTWQLPGDTFDPVHCFFGKPQEGK